LVVWKKARQVIITLMMRMGMEYAHVYIINGAHSSGLICIYAFLHILRYMATTGEKGA
jgi:hypothetical protein